MSLKAFEREVKDFLASPRAEVLLITGAWGTGKTYAWREARIRQRDALHHAFGSYAYVSLFGISDADEARAEIIASLEDFRKSPQDDLPFVNTRAWLVKILNRIYRLGRLAPEARAYDQLATRIFMKRVCNSVVCIDDLERIGNEHLEKSLLGIVNELKIVRNCKVVLITNKQKLISEEEFDIASEKIVDRVHHFEPEAQEAFNLVIPYTVRHREYYLSKIETLDIKNMRTIKKTHEFIAVLYDKISDDRLIEECINSLCLMIFSKLQPLEGPDFHQLLNATYVPSGARGQVNTEQGDLILKKYGYLKNDELTSVMYSWVDRGHLSIEDLYSAVNISKKRNLSYERYKEIVLAWNHLHESVENNEDEFVRIIFNATMTNMDFASIGQVNSAIRIFRELGQDRQADELIESFFLHHIYESEKDYDLRSDRFFGIAPVDDKFAARFEHERKKFEASLPTIQEMMVRIGKGDQKGGTYVKALVDLTVDELADAIRSIKGPDLEIAIEGCLQRRLVNPDTHQVALTGKTKKALRMIAAENRVAAIMLRRFELEPDA